MGVDGKDVEIIKTDVVMVSFANPMQTTT